ncbi:gluconate 5-dehydrogenase [Yersinia similis]
MDVFTASLRSACSFRCKHFVNNLKPFRGLFIR